MRASSSALYEEGVDNLENLFLPGHGQLLNRLDTSLELGSGATFIFGSGDAKQWIDPWTSVKSVTDVSEKFVRGGQESA